MVWTVDVALWGKQQFLLEFHPQPDEQEGVVVVGCWGTQQFLPLFHSQELGQEVPLGGLGAFEEPP